MKVLVACEESQTVCTAFRNKGIEAYNCDIECYEPPKHPEWYIQQDVLKLINGDCSFKTLDGEFHEIKGEWDLIIAHPPCTYLSNAGSKYLDVEKYGDKAIKRRQNQKEAFEFFMKFVNAKCNKIAIENPRGYCNSHYRKPDQIIQPYYFSKEIGDENYQIKLTCLWLKNLPPLKRINSFPKPEPTSISPSGIKRYFADNVSGSNRKDQARNRSKTFTGIAEAMANQWS